MIVHLASDLATRSFPPIAIVDVSPFHSDYPPAGPLASKAARWTPTTALAGVAERLGRLASAATTVGATDRWNRHRHSA